MIRFILICIVVCGFLILAIPLLGIEWIIGKFNSKAKDLSSLHIVQAVFRLCLKISGIKLTVIGEVNIPKDQPVLYIANHRSQFDILLTYTHCPGLTGFVAKAELEKIPLLRNWMRYLHCLFLDRKDIKKGLKTILAGIEKIKSGISICIFPEGTRSRSESDLDMLEFHEGSFKLATKTNCPIIPIAINNTSAVFEKQFPRIKKTHVIMEYCKPIIPSELKGDDKKFIGKYTRNVILETLKKNEELL